MIVSSIDTERLVLTPLRVALRRVEAQIHPQHLASQAVARRLGLLLTDQCDDDGEEIWAADLDAKPSDRQAP